MPMRCWGVHLLDACLSRRGLRDGTPCHMSQSRLSVSFRLARRGRAARTSRLWALLAFHPSHLFTRWILVHT